MKNNIYLNPKTTLFYNSEVDRYVVDSELGSTKLIPSIGGSFVGTIEEICAFNNITFDSDNRRRNNR